MKGLHALCALVLVLTVCTLCAAPAPRARKAPRPTPAKSATKSQPTTAPGAPADDADLLGLAVSSQAMSRVRAVPARSAVVSSLLSYGPSRGKLESLARAKGMSGTQLQTRSLNGASLSGIKVLSVDSALQTAVASLPEYDEIDWYGGVYFTPLMPGPQFKTGTRTYKLATLGCFGIRTGGVLGLSEMYHQNVLRLDRLGEGKILMWLDIPNGSGTYAATIKLMSRAGETFAEWLGDRSLSSSLHFSPYTGILGANAQALSVAPLSDGSGAVALFTVTPVPMTYTSGQLRELQMRRINCKLEFIIRSTSAAPDLLFGGIKIEKF